MDPRGPNGVMMVTEHIGSARATCDWPWAQPCWTAELVPRWFATRLEVSKRSCAPGADMSDLPTSIDYFVEAGGVKSDVFTMHAADLPYVKQLEMEYVFPAYTGLAPRKAEASPLSLKACIRRMTATERASRMIPGAKA